MELKELKPRKALNKAFLKVKPNRTEIEGFKTNLIQLLDRTNDTESEEFHKNLVIDFLKKTYYDPDHFINTKGRNDLVIHNGNNASSSVGVIIEAKKPTNKTEMITTKKLNAKAFQELVLYYLRERITHKNLEVKHLVATNINEWFIFDATLFDRLFAQNKNLVKQFNDFEGGRLADTKTDFFYKQIAEPFIADIKTEIEFTYFDLQEYQKPLRNSDKADDNKLIALFKLLSAEHLLKLPFTNDSNSLDKRFYSELLHIIGLTETKEGSKKIIERNKEGERNSGSILEDAIIQLDSLDKINRLDRPSQFGSTQQERLFNVGLELSITWINRILFLKLLEAQLITYHKGDKSYSFLSLDKIKNYDDLNSLFFQVLARKYDDRNQDVKKTFEKVPYLNSSLFEPTEIEQVTLFISNLKDDKTIPVISSTVLKNDQGKKRTGNLTTLEYLFDFLNAYDFTSEGSEEIQEDNKSLINASVLGLIFEKINGYKDGSFFTPGFITMYMCRETIRKSVVQKFNETKKWNCSTVEEIYDKIEDRKEANEIVNSIKICDPAVGSGHFLVSALNEMIAVKNDLKILQDRTGKRLKEYQVEVVNDELIITDEEGELFDYNPTNKESQRIQETLFHEKQTIIENCLFGVDINPNSVKICRLRLWIELLKNAYYKNATELETLPNIDINIKCGNSLVSRFAIDADLSQTLKKSKWSIDSYRIAVDTYRNAESKEQKREMEKLIADIKSDFRSEISLNDPKAKKLRKLSGDLFTMTKQTQLFEMGKKEKADWNKKVSQLTEETKKLETEIEIIKSNKIFENAFEWRFEFPEVLNDDGDFVGFDCIIANPPYVKVQELDHKLIDWYKENKKVAHKRIDISILFFELSQSLLKNNGVGSFISSNQFLVTEYGRKLREFLLNDYALTSMIDYGDLPIFEDALTYVSIFNLSKNKPTDFSYCKVENIDDAKILNFNNKIKIDIAKLSSDNWVLSSKNNKDILEKILKQKTLSKIAKCSYGIVSGADSIFIVNDKVIESEQLEKDSLLPLIRANNCSRYDYANYDLQIIYPFKYDDGATVLLTEDEFKNTFPNTFKYLLSKRELLEERKDSRKTFADSNKWYSLTRFGQLENFKKEKIVFPGEQKKPKFSIDRNQSGYSGARVFGVTITETEINLKFLLAILNSKVITFVIHSTFPVKAGGYFSMSSTFVEKLPIIQLSASNQKPLIDLTTKILEAKQKGEDTSTLELEVDQLVYKLYDLTEEEVKIIENI
jgi:hypothetical protein